VTLIMLFVVQHTQGRKYILNPHGCI
jgi:hypothetical protein